MIKQVRWCAQGIAPGNWELPLQSATSCLIYFLTVLEPGRSGIQVVAELVSGESSLLGSLMSISLLLCLYTVFLGVCMFLFEFSFLIKLSALLDHSLSYWPHFIVNVSLKILSSDSFILKQWVRTSAQEVFGEHSPGWRETEHVTVDSCMEATWGILSDLLGTLLCAASLPKEIPWDAT